MDGRIITLSRQEKSDVSRVAGELAESWGGSQADWAKTFSGLGAEMAVIKFFNQRLGAVPRLELNAIYENGGDGGFDFRHPKDLKWDVKSSTGDFDSEYVKKTKADCVVFVGKLPGAYKMLGFALVSKLPDGQITQAQILENGAGRIAFTLETIVKLYPASFSSQRRQALYNDSSSRMEQISPIVASVMRHIAKSAR